MVPDPSWPQRTPLFSVTFNRDSSSFCIPHTSDSEGSLPSWLFLDHFPPTIMSKTHFWNSWQSRDLWHLALLPSLSLPICLWTNFLVNSPQTWRLWHLNHSHSLHPKFFHHPTVWSPQISTSGTFVSIPLSWLDSGHDYHPICSTCEILTEVAFTLIAFLR